MPDFKGFFGPDQANSARKCQTRELVKRIKTSVMGLAELPFRHALVGDDNLASQGFRQTMVDNYMIFYLVFKDDTIVTVVRILYGRRDWINLLKNAPGD